MVEHTPGPWEVNLKGQDATVCCPDGRFFNIGDHLYHPENKANAQLIAAAPDLLAACQSVLWAFEQAKECFKKDLVPPSSSVLLREVKEAIAKAGHPVGGG